MNTIGPRTSDSAMHHGHTSDSAKKIEPSTNGVPSQAIHRFVSAAAASAGETAGRAATTRNSGAAGAAGSGCVVGAAIALIRRLLRVSVSDEGSRRRRDTASEEA